MFYLDHLYVYVAISGPARPFMLWQFHCQSQALTKRGRAPSTKWSDQNLTGRTVGSGPGLWLVFEPVRRCRPGGTKPAEYRRGRKFAVTPPSLEKQRITREIRRGRMVPICFYSYNVAIVDWPRETRLDRRFSRCPLAPHELSHAHTGVCSILHSCILCICKSIAASALRENMMRAAKMLITLKAGFMSIEGACRVLISRKARARQCLTTYCNEFPPRYKPIHWFLVA